VNIIDELKNYEGTAIVEGIAMMTYNPSIGRVLEKGGVEKFIELMVDIERQLEGIGSQEEFNNFHDSVVNYVIEKIKTVKSEKPSYGQAQKPINVFLKVYVDWASRPTLEISNKLRKYLHVPLDSILMRMVKEKFPDEHRKYVVGIYDLIQKSIRENLIKQGEESYLHRIVNPSEFSLSGIIFKEMYYAWQKCMRAIYPEKPILLDIFWSLNR